MAVNMIPEFSAHGIVDVVIERRSSEGVHWVRVRFSNEMEEGSLILFRRGKTPIRIRTADGDELLPPPSTGEPYAPEVPPETHEGDALPDMRSGDVQRGDSPVPSDG
jgi:hypothetical protein